MKDLEFRVKGMVYLGFKKALHQATTIYFNTGKDVFIDVICYSEKAAYAWGGEDLVASYREDPEASVTQRIEIKARVLGRIA